MRIIVESLRLNYCSQLFLIVDLLKCLKFTHLEVGHLILRQESTTTNYWLKKQKPYIILMLCSNTLMLSKFSNISPLSVPFCLALLPYIPITYVTLTNTYMCHLICKYTFRHDVFHENILLEFIYIKENRMSKAELPNWKYIDVRTKINQELKISLKVIVEIFLQWETNAYS